MNELMKFTNESFGEIRGCLINNEPWLVGKDIVEKLGYNLSGKHVASEYIKKFCDKEDYILHDKNSPLKQGSVLDYRKLGQRGGYLINESGMYSLTFGSKLDEAKKFKHWVTSVVLPSIRKDGAYITGEEKFKDDELDEDEFVLKAMTILQNKVERLKNEKKQLEIKNKEMLPKADFYDTVLSCENTMTITEIAKTYGKAGKWLNDLLHDEKVQYKQSGRWFLYSKYADKGYVKDSTYVYGENKSKSTMKWTQNGRKFIYDLLKEKYNIIPFKLNI